MSEKIAYFILGTNGSGKTTLYNKKLNNLNVEYLNTDDIAKDLQNEGMDKNISIGKSSTIAIKKISQYINEAKSFLTESTFSSDGHMSTLSIINELKKNGYAIKAYYLGTNDLNINVTNIRNRVKSMTGHYIERSLVYERFDKSLNLLNSNLEIFNEIKFIDNSDYNYDELCTYSNTNGFDNINNTKWLSKLDTIRYFNEVFSSDINSISSKESEAKIISFKDGGVLALLENNKTSTLIETEQVKRFKKNKLQISDIALSEVLEKHYNKSSISYINNNNENSYKQYTLSNGLDIKLNTHGVLVDDKEYYTFEDFTKEYKDKLNEDAYYEFNKYCVKQDTGDRLINPFNLDVNDINIDDIVTALSGINRFAGQTKKLQSDFSEGDNFYTVGQHTLAMYDAIKNNPSVVGLEHVSDIERNKLAKMALVHESFEGITGTDLITPFKYATKKNEYKIAELEAEAVMEKIFDLPLMNSELKRIDKAMAATEGTYLVGNKNIDWSSYGNVLDKSVLKTGMSQKEVCEHLKEKFEVEGLFQKVEDYKARFNSSLNPYSTDVIFKAKYEKLQSVLNEIGNYNEKALSLVSKQRINSVENKGNEVTLILENGNNLYVSANEVYLENNSRKINVDLDDFMINQKFSDLTRLDYFENEGANNQLMEFEKSFGTKINNDEIKVGL